MLSPSTDAGATRDPIARWRTPEFVRGDSVQLTARHARLVNERKRARRLRLRYGHVNRKSGVTASALNIKKKVLGAQQALGAVGPEPAAALKPVRGRRRH